MPNSLAWAFLISYVGGSIAIRSACKVLEPSLSLANTWSVLVVNLFVNVSMAHHLEALLIDKTQEFSLAKFVINLVLMTILSDIVFGVLHQLFHMRWLYDEYHWIRHWLKIPSPETSFFLHPMENLVVNVGTLYLVVGILKPDFYSALMFVVLTTLSTLLAHTRYQDTPPEECTRIYVGNFPSVYDWLISKWK